MPAQLINSKEDVVIECIRGLCATTPFLTYLDGFPDIKVVLDATFDKESHVAVISGGGAGHEPAHAGYVGRGMLSAAVIGGVFASPPAEAVLASLRTMTGGPGCLLIVKNYTGDRLNFGLAAEQAKGLGLEVEMLVVGDDCALPGTGLAGRRGIAGTVFVHKIAGAAAASGLPLQEVKALAAAAAAAVGSMGIATQACTLPGSEPTSRLAKDEVEMGLGIHGEPGASKRKMTRVDEIVAEVVDKIVDSMRFGGSGTDFALLANNLGGTTCLEMGIVARAAVAAARAHGLSLARCWVGSFMTALDMHGFSLSLLPLDGRRAALLDAATEAPAWPSKAATFEVRRPVPLPPAAGSNSPPARPPSLSDFGRRAEDAISGGALALLEAHSMLDDWDAKVGDGDCGTTVARGADAVHTALAERMPLNDAAASARCLADCARSMGGTSGALYNIFFTAAAARLPEEGGAGPAEFADAFEAGVAAIVEYGGASEGHRTMLDALKPAATAFSHAVDAGRGGQAAARAAAEAAQRGAEATKEMAAGAGRSSYVPDSELRGVPDPGASAAAIWLRAVSDALL